MNPRYPSSNPAAFSWVQIAQNEFAQYHLDKALAAIDEALRLNPIEPNAARTKGNILRRMWRLEPALECYRRAIEIDPGDHAALRNTGGVLQMLKRYSEAAEAYRSELRICKDFDLAHRAKVLTQLITCLRHMGAVEDASELENSEEVCAALRQGFIEPFLALMITDDPGLQQVCARQAAPSPTSVFAANAQVRANERIRVGFLSGDFYEHPTAQLTAEMFEVHDRSSFELFAYSTGPDDGSQLRRRIMNAFEHFTDARRLSDIEVARAIAADRIDILIDMGGHTSGSRLGIVAHKPAPVVAHYLGYPGTLGSRAVDYYIADAVIAPTFFDRYFDESVVRLPGSYQVSDSHRVRPKRDKSILGIPSTTFVFCAFHGVLKLSKECLAAYLEILRQTPDAVLWLLADEAVQRNLIAFAQQNDVDPSRLLFAPRTGREEYFQRLAASDLFLDSWPCGAHTTAGEALWVGCPVLTKLGSSLAGRVAASLLTSVGLPELIVSDRASFIRTAVDLASNRVRLSNLRAKLAANALNAPLFDTRRTTRHLERAFKVMIERHRRGEAPSSLTVEENQRQ